MTGRKNRDTLLTENDRFLGMKEVYLMDPGNPEDRDRIRIFRMKQGDFVIFRRFLCKTGPAMRVDRHKKVPFLINNNYFFDGAVL